MMDYIARKMQITAVSGLQKQNVEPVFVQTLYHRWIKLTRSNYCTLFGSRPLRTHTVARDMMYPYRTIASYIAL